jgi:hypothetical protein
LNLGDNMQDCEGYFFIALGERYIDECFNLSNTIRKQNDVRPIAILIHENDLEYAKSKNIFNQFIFFESSAECKIWNICKNYFEKYCLYPRLHLNDYTPFKHSITVDSDVLCQYSTDELWNFVKQRPYPVQMVGRKKDLDWQCGKLQQVIDVFGKHIPHVHGGFFYINKSSTEVKYFFDYVKEIVFKYDEYKCSRGYATPNGMVDEILFAIAHANFGIDPIEFDEYPVMTFNYTPDVKIPSTLQTENNQNINMKTPIPFVHMFDKLYGHNYKSLLNTILN